MTVSTCMIPLRERTLPSAISLSQHLVETWPSLPPVDHPTDKDLTASFSVGISNVIVGLMPEGIPRHDLEGPCSTAVLWPNAIEDLKESPAHLIVTVSGELDDIALATLMTQVASSLIEIHDTASGVFWRNAAKLIRRDIFIDLAVGFMPDGPPMDLWVDYRMVADKDQTVTGFTTGMRSLGHMEIEAVQVPETAERLTERMMDIGRYVVERGPVLSDGDTISSNGDTGRIGVSFTESLFGHSGRVMRLVYE